MEVIGKYGGWQTASEDQMPHFRASLKSQNISLSARSLFYSQAFISVWFMAMDLLEQVAYIPSYSSA